MISPTPTARASMSTKSSVTTLSFPPSASGSVVATPKPTTTPSSVPTTTQASGSVRSAP